MYNDIPIGATGNSSVHHPQMQVLPAGSRQGRIAGDMDMLDAFAAEIEKVENALPRHLNADPEKMEQGLAKLVLALVDLLRRLLEKQAIRRIEGGSLDDEEIERLGLAFMRMELKMEELKLAFDLQNEDLNLNLGPLGDLW
jgi:hypothetical protein